MSTLAWFAAVGYQQKSQEGYVVAAYRTGDTWQFSAYAPEAMPTLTSWQWWHSADMHEHYALGEPIPQRSPHIGVRSTAAAARALCAAHHATAGVGTSSAPCTSPEPESSGFLRISADNDRTKLG